MRWLTLFIFLILCIGIGFYLGFIRLSDIAAGHLKKTLQVAVSIDSISLGLNNIKVEQIQIGNPPGYALPKAFSAREIDSLAFVTQYFKKEVIIDEVTVNDIYLGLEFDSPISIKGNWTVLMDNLAQSLAQSEEDESSPRTVLIKRLILTNINTQLFFRGKGASQNLPLIDRIEFTNITSTGGIPIDQLVASILGQMLQSIFVKNHLQNMIDSVKKHPKKTTKKILKPIQKFFS